MELQIKIAWALTIQTAQYWDCKFKKKFQNS